MNLAKASHEELIAEMRKRRLINERTASLIIQKIFGISQTSRRKAEEWIKQNPETFAQMESLALHFAAEEKRDVSSRLIVETVRSSTSDARIPNSITKHLNKILIERHAEIADIFKKS